MVTVFISGCGWINIPSVPEENSEITIKWEEDNDDHMVVSYQMETSTAQNRKTDQHPINPLTIHIDTLKDDYSALFQEIESWIGTPYRYGNHEKRKGTDCSGFTMEIYQSVYGIPLNRSSEGQVSNTIPVKNNDLQVGDLVFYKIRGNRVSHVGIYIGNHKFVHATTQRGVIISDMGEKYYKDRYYGSGRVIKTENQK